MVSCSKCGLTVGKKSKEERISFHRFPSNSDQRQRWMNFMGTDEEPKKFAVLCSNHFEASCFDPDSFAYVKLKPDAVPTIEALQSKKTYNKHGTTQKDVCMSEGENTEDMNLVESFRIL
uniref:THAP domain-containing protein 2 n=1 Tax=Cacopsylla melanoneura TaxID=428564 RepID=A0A8D8LTG6_9HEMI